MAASSTNSWLHTSLLSPTSQQQSTQNTLYGSDVQLQSASHVQQQQTMNLGRESQRPCGAFCQPHTCPLTLDFHQSEDSHQLQDFSKPAGGSCSGGNAGGKGSSDYGGPVSARKIHKADREKLRRDRLNEQFAELAGVLDPDRPRNDKATILGDSVQVVKKLRSEVKRLRTDQTSLLDESRDLTQEKTELREEKAALKTETEQLQAQLQQRLRLMLPWISMDSSMMMPPYGYPMPISHPVSAPPPTSEPNQQPGLQGSMPQQQLPPVSLGAPPYIPLPSPPPGPFALHPSLYTMYANRPGDGNAPYLSYPHYPSQVSSPHPQVERPYPQYASPMQPYLMQMHQAHQGGPTPISGAPPVPSMYQSFPPCMPLVPPRTEGIHPNDQQARVGSRHTDSAYGPHGPPVLQPYPGLSGSMASVQTTLQLQTPVHPQPQRPSHLDKMEELSKADTGGTGSPTLGTRKENQPAPQNAQQPSGVGNSTDISPLTTASADLASPGSYSTPSRGEAVPGGQGGEGGEAVGAPEQQDSLGTHDPTLRPPAA